MSIDRRVKRQQQKQKRKDVKKAAQKLSVGKSRGLDIKALSKYANERKEGDIDLVEKTREHIENQIDKKSADLFANHPTIINVKNKAPEVQRVIINKFFTGTFMAFRSMKEVKVYEQVNLLVMDGDLEDWLKIFHKITTPFLKDHKVLTTVYK
jgi:hypothetical protein